jgi:2-dehydro-3-deoxygalactonokinase
MRGQGLLHTAFSVRTLSLFKQLSTNALPSYLSGIVIGEELHSQTLAAGESVVLIGAPALTARYEAALSQQGVRAERVDSHATWHGLHAIAGTLLD